MIRALIAKYELPILGVLLVLFFYFGYHTRVVLDKAAASDRKTVVIQAIPKIITETQTITKVVHDAKDDCTNAALPAPIAEQLRK